MKVMIWEKNNACYFQGNHQPFPQFPTPETINLESNYSKTLRQTGNTTSNQISFKVPCFWNIFLDIALEGGREQPSNRIVLGSKLK